MTRALSGPTTAAVAKTFTQPGHLVQLGFASVLRYSSRSDVTWNGSTWQANNVTVGALVELPNGSATISIAIGNTDRAFGAVVLGQAPQEVAVGVWAFYEGATAAADPVQIFGGVIDAADITEASVVLTCSDLNAKTIFLPRQRVSRATGFNHLMPASRVIEWNGWRLTLDRGL